MTISSMIAIVSELVTGAQTWINSFVNTISTSPLLLMFVVLGFVGLAVGLIRRIISLG